MVWRQKYIEDIKGYRDEGRTIYFLDETWVGERGAKRGHGAKWGHG